MGVFPSAIMVNHSILHISFDFFSALLLNKHFLTELMLRMFLSGEKILIDHLGAAKKRK